MPIICWGNLAKSADDTQRIEQAIMAYVEGHDENPNAHMGEDYALGAHRLQTILDHPYNSIYPWHIYAINAHRISTGALIVKGQGPYIVVQDAVGVEKVRIYPEGIIVHSGKIVVKDEDDETFIDAKGIVSTVAFETASATKTADQNIGGDFVWTNITVLTHDIVLTRNTKVLVFGVICWGLGGSDADVAIRIKYNDSVFPDGDGWIGGSLKVDSYGTGFFSFSHILTLPAGTNTVLVQAARTTPDETLKILGQNQRSTFGYIVLGT